MKIRKLTGWMAAAAICLLTACGDGGDAGQQQNAATPTAAAVQQGTDDAAPTQAAAENKTEATAREIYDQICAKYTLPDMVFLDDDGILNSYGLEAAKIDSYVCAEATEVRADRVFIVKLKDAADVADAETKLGNVLGQLSSQDSLDYYPEQADVITAAEVKTKGNTVYLFISEYADGMEEILLNALN